MPSTGPGILFLALALALAISLSACGASNPERQPPPPEAAAIEAGVAAGNFGLRPRPEARAANSSGPQAQAIEGANVTDGDAVDGTGRAAGNDRPSVGGNGSQANGGIPGNRARPAQVRIRLRNRSDSLALEDVVVHFPRDSARFGFIRPGRYSAYFGVDTAYRFAAIRAKAGGKEYFCQPVDFTGETPLAPGDYTYALTQVRDRKAKTGYFLLELIEEHADTHP